MGRKFLNFDERFLKKLKSGRKTATLRLGRKKYKVGEVVKVMCGKEYLGEALITDVRYITLDEVDEATVREEGYRSKKGLERDLRQFYGDFGENEIFTLIKFRLASGRRRRRRK
ncbi:MAG TPA: ASCH domain-containing protein [Methanomicrobia archaeon]|nr:ASCH domain-containing protein [Methanomicrobia archaeon]HEX59901.1 ASCH domain-containing protein [Methanomicrobia archaeon]